MSSLFMSSTKWNFPWFISEAWLLEKWTSGKRKKQDWKWKSVRKNRHTHTRNIINSCLFTKRKSLKSRKRLLTLDERYKLQKYRLRCLQNPRYYQICAIFLYNIFCSIFLYYSSLIFLREKNRGKLSKKTWKIALILWYLGL